MKDLIRHFWLLVDTRIVKFGRARWVCVVELVEAGL